MYTSMTFDLLSENENVLTMTYCVGVARLCGPSQRFAALSVVDLWKSPSLLQTQA